MAENNTSNTPAETPSASSAKRRIIICAVCLALVALFLVLFFGSVSLYRKSAEEGNKEAQFALGMHYRYGLGVKKDKIKAWDLWRMAADQNLKPAQDKLAKIHKEIEKAANDANADVRVQLAWGSCLANGWGPKKDEGEGWTWWVKAAEQNHEPARQKLVDFQKDIEKAATEKADAKAQFVRGVCLDNGWGTTKDGIEAWTFWWKSSAQNFEPAKARLVNALKDIETAAKAEKADPRAQLAWGMCLNNGWGTERNEAEALEWLNKSGETDSGIQYELGLCCGRGIGIKKDEKTAFNWFSKAAVQDHAEAKYELALCFLNGRGVDKDELKAFEWLVSAAEKSDSARKELSNNQQNIEKAAKAEKADPRAQLVWGTCIVNGWGPKKDTIEGWSWWLKAAEQNHEPARKKLEGSRPNIESVAKAEKADPGAQFILGLCLANAWGSEKDVFESWIWWAKAAEQKHKLALERLEAAYMGIESAANAENADARAQLVQGKRLANAWGVEKDEKDALGWFRKAAEKGNAEAQYELALRLLNGGEGIDKDEANAFAWLVKAAGQDLKSARMKLSEIYQKIEKSANVENADAGMQLIWGKCLANGWGPQKDEAAAFEWFKKAAENGNAEAKAIVERKEKEEAGKNRKEASDAAAPANAAEPKADAPEADAPEREEGN